jgi:hypothetical protein
MANIANADRVKIWNSFFKLAWGEAKSVFEESTATRSLSEKKVIEK